MPYGAGNKTEWPIEGGSVALDLHHPWSYLYINLGLGENSTNFNISLTPDLLNVTGRGDFCIPVLPVPIPVADGQNATIQFVTNGQSGSALYNVSESGSIRRWVMLTCMRRDSAPILYSDPARNLSLVELAQIAQV